MESTAAGRAVAVFGYQNEKAHPQENYKDQADYVRKKQNAQIENSIGDCGHGEPGRSKKKDGGARTTCCGHVRRSPEALYSGACHSLGDGKGPPISEGSGFQNSSHIMMSQNCVRLSWRL